MEIEIRTGVTKPCEKKKPILGGNLEIITTQILNKRRGGVGKNDL